jgi:hypothetical protein
MAILEPEKFHDRYLLRPADIDLRTKAGKAWAADARENGYEILNAAQSETLEQVCLSVERHEGIQELLIEATRETVVEWSIDGIACKARLDILGPDMMGELKTCRDLARFERDAARLLYHGQCAWYSDGAVKADLLSATAKVYMVVVETSEPYDCGIYRVTPGILEDGRDLYTGLLGYWRECQAADLWPGLCPGIQNLSLPSWAVVGEEEEF